MAGTFQTQGFENNHFNKKILHLNVIFLKSYLKIIVKMP